MPNPESSQYKVLGTQAFLKLIRSAVNEGYGFVPLLGSGLSAAAGIPTIPEISQYLKRCISLALGTVRGDISRWNPRNDAWPSFQEFNSPEWINRDEFVELYNTFDRRTKEKGEKSEELRVLQEALGAMADWRTSLLYLARIAWDRSRKEPDGRARLYLSAPDFDVVDAFFLQVIGDRSPTMGHLMLAQLADLMKMTVLLTTNFDELLEEAFREIEQPLVALDVHSAAALPSFRHFQSQRVLVKLHGGRFGLRADYSLDSDPSENDRRRFASYFAGEDISADSWSRWWHQAMANAVQKKPVEFTNLDGSLPPQTRSHLLVMGFSGKDRRIMDFVKNAVRVLRALDDAGPDDSSRSGPRIFWICYSQSDEEEIESFCKEELQLKVVEAPVASASLPLTPPRLRKVTREEYAKLTHVARLTLMPVRKQISDLLQGEELKREPDARRLIEECRDLLRQRSKILRATVAAGPLETQWTDRPWSVLWTPVIWTAASLALHDLEMRLIRKAQEYQALSQAKNLPQLSARDLRKAWHSLDKAEVASLSSLLEVSGAAGDDADGGRPACVILRHQFQDQLALQLYQTLTDGLPAHGAVFPISSHLPVPPIALGVRGQRSVDIWLQSHYDRREGDLPGPWTRYRELKSKIKAEDRLGNAYRLICITSDRGISGVASFGSLLFFHELGNRAKCLWLRLDEINSADELFEQLTEAVVRQSGERNWKPIQLHSRSDRLWERNVEEIELRTRGDKPWIIFLDCRDAAGTSLTPHIPFRSNGWISRPAQEAWHEPEDGSENRESFANLLKDLCGRKCPNVWVVLLCCNERLTTGGGTQSNAPLEFGKWLMREGFHEAIDVRRSLPKLIPSHSALDEPVPTIFDDSRDGDLVAEGVQIETLHFQTMQAALQWVIAGYTDYPAEEAPNEPVESPTMRIADRFRFLLALVEIRRTRYPSALLAWAFFSSPETTIDRYRRKRLVEKWLKTLASIPILRITPGGFVWMHRLTRDSIRRWVEKVIEASGTFEASLQPTIDEELKKLRYQVQNGLGAWYEKLFQSSESALAAVEAAFHYLTAARDGLRHLLRLLAKAPASEKRIDDWFTRSHAALNDSLRMLDESLPVVLATGNPKTCCRQLLQLRTFVLNELSTPLRRAIDQAAAREAASDHTVRLLRLNQRVERFLLLCQRIMRELAFESGETARSYWRHCQYLALLHYMGGKPGGTGEFGPLLILQEGKPPRLFACKSDGTLSDGSSNRVDRDKMLRSLTDIHADYLPEVIEWLRADAAQSVVGRSFAEADRSLNLLYEILGGKSIAEALAGEPPRHLPEWEARIERAVDKICGDVLNGPDLTSSLRARENARALARTLRRQIDLLLHRRELDILQAFTRAFRTDSSADSEADRREAGMNAETAPERAYLTGRAPLLAAYRCFRMMEELWRVLSVEAAEGAQTAQQSNQWTSQHYERVICLGRLAAIVSRDGDSEQALRRLDEASSERRHLGFGHRFLTAGLIELYRAEVRLGQAVHLPPTSNKPYTELVPQRKKIIELLSKVHDRRRQRQPVSHEDIRRWAAEKGAAEEESQDLQGPEVFPDLLACMEAADVALRRAAEHLPDRRKSIALGAKLFELKLKTIEYTCAMTITEFRKQIRYLDASYSPGGTSTEADHALRDALRVIRYDVFQLARIVESYALILWMLELRLILDSGRDRLSNRRRIMTQLLRKGTRRLETLLRDRRTISPALDPKVAIYVERAIQLARTVLRVAQSERDL